LKVAEILIRNMSMPGDLSGKTKSGIKQWEAVKKCWKKQNK
jgi:hypothetical protein